MPYVSKKRRYELEAPGEIPSHPGDLNYKLTLEVLRFLGDRPNYERFNAAIGALEACKMELYRRMVAPYEDGKIAENGDVYPATIGNVGALTPEVIDEGSKEMWRPSQGGSFR